MSTAPGGSTSPPGTSCIPCTTGNLEVTIYRQLICWDTPPAGENATDPPLEGAIVTVSGPGRAEPITTGRDGKARFVELVPGTYTIIARKEGLSDVTEEVLPDLRTDWGVVALHTTNASVRVLRRELECKRRHTALPGGATTGPFIWLPVLWIPWSEPWILWIRDLVWLFFTVLMVLGFIPIGSPGVVAWSAAFFGYLCVVIFGAGLGIAAIVVASVLFIGLLLTAFIPSFLGLPPPDPWFLPMTCATWTGFVFALAAGRRPEFRYTSFTHTWLIVIIGGLLGLVVALITLLLAFPGPAWALVLGVLICSFLSAAVAALLGHAFVNDGKTDARHWGDSDFRLPYEGERYCVQGLRGFISHFEHQEYSYDWAIPEGTPYICAKEGHIIKFSQNMDGNTLSGNTTANEVHVKHRDGSIAEYLHGKRGGVSAINEQLIRAAMDLGYVLGELTNVGGRREADLSANPVHVHAGQQLSQAGNVGLSMFSHLHFTVRRKPGAPANPGDPADYSPVKFADPDVSRHGGVCFSMRKYLSSNPNRGAIVVPPSPAPFRPSGGGVPAGPPTPTTPPLPPTGAPPVLPGTPPTLPTNGGLPGA